MKIPSGKLTELWKIWKITIVIGKSIINGEFKLYSVYFLYLEMGFVLESGNVGNGLF